MADVRPASVGGERSGMRSLVRSAAINGAGAFVVFHLATKHYPANSPWPLVWSGVIPAFNLVRGIVATRSVDFVAALVFLDIVGNAIVAFATGSLTAVFIAHGLRHAVVGLAFLISFLIDRPLIAPLAKQIVAGDDAAARHAFDERARRPTVHAAFRRVTLVWALAFLALSAVLVVVAIAVHSSKLYVIDAAISYPAIGLLVLWTIGWIRRRARAAQGE